MQLKALSSYAVALLLGIGNVAYAEYEAEQKRDLAEDSTRFDFPPLTDPLPSGWSTLAETNTASGSGAGAATSAGTATGTATGTDSSSPTASASASESASSSGSSASSSASDSSSGGVTSSSTSDSPPRTPIPIGSSSVRVTPSGSQSSGLFTIQTTSPTSTPGHKSTVTSVVSGASSTGGAGGGALTSTATTVVQASNTAGGSSPSPSLNSNSGATLDLSAWNAGIMAGLTGLVAVMLG
ncbi:hypothetical protein PVAR5_3799 [Paecilomyces variotii No. 5]|uniref:GPI anchored protein n=1 Tax=Byssochlamys spectabilis (strain No. 5 / NBRC 109023) TaxID=1356009 RepID=V5HYS0_BYSSN|nr:hypothetical protein PVAR5_3799 [Paecilomyces variotii No. 5]